MLHKPHIRVVKPATPINTETHPSYSRSRRYTRDDALSACVDYFANHARKSRQETNEVESLEMDSSYFCDDTDYTFNRELAIQEGISDYWQGAMRSSTAECPQCYRLITEPWWSTLLVPEAVISRTPLCSSLCLVTFCTYQQWNTGIVEMALDYPESPEMRNPIRLDISQPHLKSRLNQLIPTSIEEHPAIEAPEQRPLQDQLRPQATKQKAVVDKLNAETTSSPKRQENRTTEIVIQVWTSPQPTIALPGDRYFIQHTTKRRRGEGTLTPQAEDKDAEAKSGPSRIKASRVTDTTEKGTADYDQPVQQLLRVRPATR